MYYHMVTLSMTLSVLLSNPITIHILPILIVLTICGKNEAKVLKSSTLVFHSKYWPNKHKLTIKWHIVRVYSDHFYIIGIRRIFGRGKAT